MVKERAMIAIEVEPESELAKALASVDDKRIILISNGARFAVYRNEDDDLWADYDPEKVRAALREAAGTLTPEEAERLKALVYEARERGSRPIGRP